MRLTRRFERFAEATLLHTLIVSVVIIWGVSLTIFIIGLGASAVSRRVAIWFTGSH